MSCATSALVGVGPTSCGGPRARADSGGGAHCDGLGGRRGRPQPPRQQRWRRRGNGDAVGMIPVCAAGTDGSGSGVDGGGSGGGGYGAAMQNVNVAGVGLFARLAFGSGRGLAIPHIEVPDIRWVEWRALKAAGFKAVVFDKDNTLTAPYERRIHPPLAESLEECVAVFGASNVAVLSNSAGLRQFDPMVGPARYCPPRHPTHVDPSSLELNVIQ